MSLHHTDLQKLLKLLSMTSSSHDNEALVAARKANELILQRGLTWQDVVVPAEPGSTDAEIKTHRFTAKQVLQDGKDIIDDWERKFLIGIMGYSKLSPAQEERLQTIAEKVDLLKGS